jgi:hypothetical protein
MEQTWASGAIELLKHADSHIHLETAFDRRIAFISIDNSTETSMRVFLSLPESRSKVKVPRKAFDEVENSFPGLVALLWQHAGNRLTGIDDADIEHYHRIRNKLYHDGTGLSVDEQYLLAYRQIAVLLLKNLFGVDLGEPKPAPTLERLIMLWNTIEETLSKQYKAAGIDRGYTFHYEEAMNVGLLSIDDIRRLTELRLIRNTQVHSTNIDRQEIQYAVHMAEMLLATLKKKSNGG